MIKILCFVFWKLDTFSWTDPFILENYFEYILFITLNERFTSKYLHVGLYAPFSLKNRGLASVCNRNVETIHSTTDGGRTRVWVFPARWRYGAYFTVFNVIYPWSFRRAHSPTFSLLLLRHNSFSNPSVASPTSQFILQPFFRFSYVTSSSLSSPGELPMI